MIVEFEARKYGGLIPDDIFRKLTQIYRDEDSEYKHMIRYHFGYRDDQHQPFSTGLKI